jgi:hypothetical protein
MTQKLKRNQAVYCAFYSKVLQGLLQAPSHRLKQFTTPPYTLKSVLEYFRNSVTKNRYLKTRTQNRSSIANYVTCLRSRCFDRTGGSIALDILFDNHEITRIVFNYLCAHYVVAAGRSAVTYLFS